VQETLHFGADDFDISVVSHPSIITSDKFNFFFKKSFSSYRTIRYLFTLTIFGTKSQIYSGQSPENLKMKIILSVKFLDTRLFSPRKNSLNELLRFL